MIASMASIASALPLLHALWVNPWFWAGLRFITGVCIVGLYIVVESWLNVVAQSHQLGKVFAAYMAVSSVSLAIGNWLILVGDRFGFVPFALVSILFSFALLPLTLTPVEFDLLLCLAKACGRVKSREQLVENQY